MLRLKSSSVVQCGDAGKHLAFQQLEAGSTTGGDVRHLFGEACFLNSSNGIATANDRAAAFSTDFSQGCGNGVGSGRELVELEHAHGAVPDHGLAISQGRLEHLDRIRTDVESHPAVGNRCDVCDLAVGIRSEVVGEQDIGREQQLNALGLCFGFQFLGQFELVFFHEALANSQDRELCKR